MSDTEEIAAAAAEEAIAETEEERVRKRKERLEQNRISARESRKRKKTMIEELQRTVITLSRDNKELNEKNEQLRRQLMDIGTKVCCPTRDDDGGWYPRIIFKTQERSGKQEGNGRPRSQRHHRSEGRQERSRSTQRKVDCNVMAFWNYCDVLTAKFFEDRLDFRCRGVL